MMEISIIILMIHPSFIVHANFWGSSKLIGQVEYHQLSNRNVMGLKR
jgi:hypothetical protein